jgi:hypothetical protein
MGSGKVLQVLNHNLSGLTLSIEMLRLRWKLN